MVKLVLEQGYRASDAEQATRAIKALFGAGTIAVESLGSLEYDQWSLVDDGISTTHIESRGATVHVDAGPAPDMVVVAVRSGYAMLEQGGQTVALQAGDLGLIALDQPARASWEQVTLDLYSFPRSSLAHLLSADTARIALRVARLKAVAPAVIALWNRAAATLSEEILPNPELAESDVVREEAIDALLGLTIQAFGISDATEDDPEHDQARLQRADAFLAANLADSISVTDVAREVGISIRGLQLVFQRTGNGTPLTYLRALRMDAAREALTTATAPIPIAEVAQRVGYSNLGRFDVHYLDAFSTLPEQDLSEAARSEAESSPTAEGQG